MEDNTNLKPVKRLICSCCGTYTTGRQWFNRDSGYGLCETCADWIAKRESPAAMESAYGKRGIHYAVKAS